MPLLLDSPTNAFLNLYCGGHLIVYETVMCDDQENQKESATQYDRTQNVTVAMPRIRDIAAKPLSSRDQEIEALPDAETKKISRQQSHSMTIRMRLSEQGHTGRLCEPSTRFPLPDPAKPR